MITPATPKDIKKVFDWRNSPEIVSVGNGETVEWSEHHRWYDSVLADDDKLLLIIGDDAGAVRLEREGKQAEISVYVVEHRRGEGLGKQAIEEATRLAFGTWPIDEVFAHIAWNNIRSFSAFKTCGYLHDYGNGKDLNHWRMVNREK